MKIHKENLLWEKLGQLMDKAFDGLEIKRKDVYIANIVKCRPPQNRVPNDEETSSCLPFLLKQIELIKPKIIVLLGSTALKNLIDKSLTITTARGKWIEKDGIKYMPTYHPAALLRDESKKIDFWLDFKEVKKELNNV